MENIAEVVKTVAKSKIKPTFELDRTGPYVHVTYKPDYNSWIKLFLNDERVGVYQMENGKVSIQLPGVLPFEYRIRVEILKK